MTFCSRKRKCNRDYKPVQTNNNPGSSSRENNESSTKTSQNLEPRYEEIKGLASGAQQNKEIVVEKGETSENQDHAYADIEPGSQKQAKDTDDKTEQESPKAVSRILNLFRDTPGDKNKTQLTTPTIEKERSVHYDSVDLNAGASSGTIKAQEKTPAPGAVNTFPDDTGKGWEENIIYVGGDVDETIRQDKNDAFVNIDMQYSDINTLNF